LELKKVKIIRAFSFIQGTILNAMRALLILVMMWLIARQDISLGQFFTLFIYSFFIFQPLSNFGAVAAQYQETTASLEQLDKILQQSPEAKPVNPKTVGALQNIVFNKASFKYNSGQQHAVDNISLKIKAGDTIAFVGPSGSGKTTLIKLLVGLYKPTQGQLLFNDIDAQTINLDALRQRIGLVSQDTQLFAGTIRDNLLFVNPKASDNDCLEVMKLAAAESILARSDKGLDSKIGEGGLKLSGGEKQRLAIARALLRQPDLIIFDEATSSLDSLTENEIITTIREIEKARPEIIMVMVAHRLSTVAHAKTIYVLEKGKLIEHGDHEGLLKKKGLYAALWRQQISVQ
jgi:ATP-binding cassette subfamily B protein